LNERVEARVLGIKRDRVIRTLIRPALHRTTATGVAATIAVSAVASAAPLTTAAITAFAPGAASEISATLPRPAIAGILAAFAASTSAAASWTAWRAARATFPWTGRPAKRPPITAVGRATGTFASIIATRTLPAAVSRGGLLLRPLRAEAEALELAEIEFVEILGRIFLGRSFLGRIFLGSVIVHVFQKADCGPRG
jgi:hypothetical protein